MCQDELPYFLQERFSKISSNTSSAFFEHHHLSHNCKELINTLFSNGEYDKRTLALIMCFKRHLSLALRSQENELQCITLCLGLVSEKLHTVLCQEPALVD